MSEDPRTSIDKPEINTSAGEAPTISQSPHGESAGTKSKKKLYILSAGVLVGVLVLGGVAFMVFGGKDKEGKNENKDQAQVVKNVEQAGGDQLSTDPIARGKYLSLNGCTGEGSKKLGSAPMKTSDVGIIEPYGLLAGGHVTPVDHEYYYGKDANAAPSTYDVLAPADGTIVNVEARNRGGSKRDYRVVISYSCTFFSYFDLANSLSDTIAKLMPAGYQDANGPMTVKIPVKQGDVLAKIGGQSLDFAVWDTTKTLSGLLVPMAYNNYEPWKINTVAPLDYFEESVKTAVLPYYVRSVAPRDGKLDHDIDGMAVGNWFLKGTNGYIGAFTESKFSSQTYADGHLTLVPNFIDPTSWMFSTGAINHGTQYAIKAPSVTPDKLDTTKGTVKYELVQVNYVDGTGAKWIGKNAPSGIKVVTTGQSQGTVLVQLIGKRELKVEVFLNKTPTQVTDFTSAATTYTRGDEAKLMTR